MGQHYAWSSSVSAAVTHIPRTPEGRDLLRFMLDCGGLRDGHLPGGIPVEGYDFDRAAQEALQEVGRDFPRRGVGVEQ
jgi:hypothetical protein